MKIKKNRNLRQRRFIETKIALYLQEIQDFMKQTLIIIFVTFLLFSCRQASENHILQQVTHRISTHPDSALRLLQQIPFPDQLPAKTYADYSLLMIEALDKTDHPLPDTLLRVAADYYLNQKDDPVGTARTCYYLGRFNMETNYAKEAQASFIKGIEALEGTNNYRLLSLLHYYLGLLYREQYMYEDAIVHHKASYKYSQLDQNTDDQIYDLRELGVDYSEAGNQDSAIVYYKQALHLLEDGSRKTNLMASLCNDLAVAYRKMSLYKDALYYINQALSSNKVEKEFFTSYLVKGMIYASMEMTDSAYWYFSQSKRSPKLGVQRSSLKHLYILEKQMNNYKEAVELNDLYMEIQDSLQKKIQTDVLFNISKRYNYEQIVKRNDLLKIKLHKTQANLYLGLIIGILFILGGIYSYKKMKKRKDQLIEETQKKINANVLAIYQKEQKMRLQSDLLAENQKQIQQQEIYLSKLEEDLKQTHSLISIQEKKFQHLQERDFQFRKKLFEKTEAYNRIKESQTKRNQLLTKDDEKLVIQTMDELFEGWASKIRDLGDLTPGNTCFCCILRLYPETTNEEIAQMFNVSVRSIEQRKYRLKKELLDGRGDKNLNELLGEI